MARGINKVILIGNMGEDPIIRQTNSGLMVANLSLVTNDMKRNPENGQTTEIAEWHRIVLFGKLAEIAQSYLHKGSQIYIEGRLKTRTYQDKQNQKRSITEIFADELQMLGNKNVSIVNKPENPKNEPQSHRGSDFILPSPPKTINQPEARSSFEPALTAVNNYDGDIPF